STPPTQKTIFPPPLAEHTVKKFILDCFGCFLKQLRSRDALSVHCQVRHRRPPSHGISLGYASSRPHHDHVMEDKPYKIPSFFSPFPLFLSVFLSFLLPLFLFFPRHGERVCPSLSSPSNPSARPSVTESEYHIRALSQWHVKKSESREEKEHATGLRLLYGTFT